MAQLRFLLSILSVIRWLLYPLMWWQNRKSTKFLPEIKDPILTMSGSKLARKIRKKELSSEQIVTAYIARIKEVNPIINAVVEERFATALEDAKKVDKYLRENSYNEDELLLQKPLLGVPMTVKESCAVKGLSLTGGIVSRKGIKASEDCDPVTLMKNAGAIPLLVSNTPELCAYMECYNNVIGTTCNPYNTNRTCSGSSGGEGALLGAGASIIGIGSDLGGSIRLPGAFCGIYGHKPSPGIVPHNGHYPTSNHERFLDFVTMGPMVRYAEDLTLTMKIMSGPNVNKLKLDQEVDFSKLNLYIMQEKRLLHPLQKEVKVTTDKCIRHLQEKCGRKLNFITFVDLNDTLERGIEILLGLESFVEINEVLNKPQDSINVYWEFFKSMFGLSNITFDGMVHFLTNKLNGEQAKNNMDKNLRRNDKLREKFAQTLGTSGILIMPTFPITAFLRGYNRLYTDAAIHTLLFNLAGLPCTQVPVGLDNKGLPIGVQVVAGPNQDHLCIAVAKELERQFGGWVPPSC